jgi:hypothetical protein
MQFLCTYTEYKINPNPSLKGISESQTHKHLNEGYLSVYFIMYIYFCVRQGLGTIQILADALPKIVPYVLINHREVCNSLIYLHLNDVQYMLHHCSLVAGAPSFNDVCN